MNSLSCIQPDCAAALPRRVNYCPYCGNLQRQPEKRVRLTAEKSPPHVIPVQPAKTFPPTPKPAQRSGIGFWLVALALMFSFWVSFSEDKKPIEGAKMRHNASQDKRK